MWKEWFSYSKLQRYGIITLSFLVVLCALFPFIHQTFIYTPDPILESNSFYAIDSFLNTLSYSKPKPKPSFSMVEEERPPTQKAERFYFDPNTVSTSELVRMGLSLKQAAVIENYRQKGGQFRQPEDFAKMYVIDSSLFAQIKPYIQIKPIEEPELKLAEKSTNEYEAPKKEETKIYLDLNTVDTLEITRIRGIGRGYARRIISYRQLLGGFYNINQLLEVYGFPQELLVSINDQVWVDTLAIKKININLVDYEELRKHPYLTDYQARAIIYYRETMGNFKSAEELTKHKLVDSKTLNRIRPYITLR
jgi:DNA uptake protein ComE-like DNA-binding protein